MSKVLTPCRIPLTAKHPGLAGWIKVLPWYWKSLVWIIKSSSCSRCNVVLIHLLKISCWEKGGWSLPIRAARLYAAWRIYRAFLRRYKTMIGENGATLSGKRCQQYPSPSFSQLLNSPIIILIGQLQPVLWIVYYSKKILHIMVEPLILDKKCLLIIIISRK